jgi:predicted short-subunit dehydrogenase-like oxidoreductase (DUF2520 family)
VSLPSVGIVGTGSLARALGRALGAAGVPVAAVASADRDRAAAVAASIGPTVQAVGLAVLPSLTQRILVVTSDARIEAVATALADAGFRGGIALHTSGALGLPVMEPLARTGVACGVFHPLQTFARVVGDPLHLFRDITVGLAGDPPAVALGDDLASRLGARSVIVAADRFAAYHAGAVLASNALSALLDAAVTLFGRAGIPPEAALDALGPLIRTAVDNALRIGPRDGLTGPVLRGDVVTIRRHLAETVEASPFVDALYRAVSRYLVELASERGLAEDTCSSLAGVLDATTGRDTT